MTCGVGEHVSAKREPCGVVSALGVGLPEVDASAFDTTALGARKRAAQRECLALESGWHHRRAERRAGAEGAVRRHGGRECGVRTARRFRAAERFEALP